MTDAAPIRFDPQAKGPLAGMRVLDLSRLVAGNMLTLQLGDFGADVIKVEPPEGDPLRAWRDGGEQLFWKTYSRNKMSMVLNLRHAAARDALLRLVETADVFVENYRPGTLEAMGLAPDLLLARNPRLVVVRISGFGQTGPYAQQPGFGTLVEAMSGFADRTGFPDREPVLPPLALADMIAGLSGAMAVVTALLARERGAAGQVVDLSLLEPIFSTLGPEAAIYRQTGAIKQRMGNGSNTSAPRNMTAVRMGDYVALSGSTQAMAKRIFAVIGKPELIEDPRFRTNTDRVRNRPLVDAQVGAWFAARPRDAALAQMREAGVTAGPVYNIRDAMADPHFQAREVLVEVEDAALGSIPVHNIVPRLSGTPGVWRRPAPALGEHTDALLASAGLDPAAIAALRAEGGLRVIRSLLYVPAHSERFVARAHERGADAVILDLEDAVPPADKAAARAALAAAVPAAGRSGATVFVRVNSGPMLDEDAEAACRAGAVGLMVPKVQSPDTLRALGARLAPVEAELGRAPLSFVPLLEDPGAVLDARPIATAGPRVLALVTGGEDLATEMDAEPSADMLRLPKLLVHLAAKAAGLLSFGLLRSIADYGDAAGIAASAREARALGFDGASCVHPAVVPILNAAFAPDPAALDHARRMVAAFEHAEAEGRGAFAFEGKMVDLPIVARARRLIARAR